MTPAPNKDSVASLLGTKLFDTHCHIDLFLEKSGFNSWNLLQTCSEYHIKTMLIPGLEPAQWPAIAQLCEQHEPLFFAVGLHPWWIQHQTLSQLTLLSTTMSQWLQHPKCIAVGETGLDGHIQTPMPLQIDILQHHLELAQDHQKPLLLHSRKTDHEILCQLKALPKTSSKPRGIVHAFSGHIETAKAFIQQGLLLGVGGTITYPRAQKTRTTVAQLPLEFLVVETDAPDMPLQGFQGQLNTPLQLPAIVQCLAELRNETMQSVATATTQTANTLFDLS